MGFCDWDRVAGRGLRAAGCIVLKDWGLGSVMADRGAGKLGFFGKNGAPRALARRAERCGREYQFQFNRLAQLFGVASRGAVMVWAFGSASCRRIGRRPRLPTGLKPDLGSPLKRAGAGCGRLEPAVNDRPKQNRRRLKAPSGRPPGCSPLEPPTREAGAAAVRAGLRGAAKSRRSPRFARGSALRAIAER